MSQDKVTKTLKEENEKLRQEFANKIADLEKAIYG